MDFEKKLNELQDITKTLEDQNLSMDEGVKLYEKGALLAKECYEMLNDVKGKVSIIKKDIDAFKEESFD